MDIVHHAFIGGVGFFALAAHEQEIAGLAFVAGSVLPDLDVAFMAFGKRAYLKNHQGLTHSYLMSPIFALLFITLPLTYALGFDWLVLVAALLGLWLHSTLDLTNTFGITILWPATVKRFCFDAVFFIDSVAWTLTALFYIGWFWLHVAWVFYLYMFCFLAYVVFKIILHRRVMKKLACRYAIPSALHPLQFFVLEENSGQVRTYLYNALSGRVEKEKSYANVDRKYYDLAATSTVYNDMKMLTKYFYITRVDENDAGTRLTIEDLGIRNFGGKFGRTELEFDSSNQLVGESANI